MKTPNQWSEDDRLFPLTSKDAAAIARDIIADALSWAAEQIVEDGNPACAKDKILRAIPQ